MAVVIEELEVVAQPQPSLPPSTPSDPPGGGEVDQCALQAALARETWRHERLAAD